jgi:sporulation protein YlmC with PRC-barrel domain
MALRKLPTFFVITLTALSLTSVSATFAAEKDPATIKATEPTVPERQYDTSTQTTQQGRMEAASQPATDIVKLSEIIGMTVENPQRDNLGEITDVVVDPSNGNVAYAVLAAGGFLGLGEKYFAIPWGAFQPMADSDDKGDVKRLILDADKDRLQNAPGFDKDNWPDMANPQWGQTVHEYYGQGDAWKQRQAMRQSGADTMNQQSPQNTTARQSGVAATVEQIRGDKVELQVPESMIQDLQAGDRVEVSIQKK